MKRTLRGMKTFVTGGSGFVGRELIRALVSEGHEVVALARSERSERAVTDAGARSARGDLDSVDALRSGVAGCEDDRAQRELGYRPVITIEEGLAELARLPPVKAQATAQG